MKPRRQKSITLILLTLLFVAVMIDPIYGFDMYLQQTATVAIIVLLGIDLFKNKLSWNGFLGIILFTALHTFGARWLYTMVPYNDWFTGYLNWDVNAQFGWTRNHYDRMVHFAFGLFLLPALRDLAKHWFKPVRLGHALIIAWLLLQFLSLFYELFEWGLTFTLSPEQVENYNGQQGDMWDPHKDMALALAGSTLSAGLIWLRNRKRKN